MERGRSSCDRNTVIEEVLIVDTKDKYKFTVLCGDKRQAVIAREFVKLGHKVSCWSLSNAPVECEICSNVDKAVDSADFIILPLPFSRDNIYLSSASDKIELRRIVELAKKNGSVILAGLVSDEMLHLCESECVEIIDYYKSESLQMKNALPSAEGAIMLAMEHTEITVYGMKALVTGYGRIGKILANILRSLGASVTVAARRDETLCEIVMSGFEAIKTNFDCLTFTEYDVIFNTVPSVILNEKVLKNIKNKPVYIEIASSPGGIDTTFARSMGMEIIFAPSLPGKYSPISAGKYIFETISEILSQRRIEI